MSGLKMLLMRRVGLFRYHSNPDICRNRLKLFSQLNPDIEVYGLYGGKEEDFSFYDAYLKDFLGGNYCLRDKTYIWKWKNGDLSIREWYKNYGKHKKFDVVHILEWDLVIMGKLDELYSHIPPDSLGVTGLTPLVSIEKEWFWTRDTKQKAEWKVLKEHVRKFNGFSGPYFASVAPGLSIPRSFLEQYSEMPVPDLCNDELRLPLYAKALDFEIYDTGFFKKWFSKTEKQYFNCNEFAIKEKKLLKELKKKKGRRVFHPFREELNMELISK